MTPRENLIRAIRFDMADDEPRLARLIGMVSDFNYEVVMKRLALKPDIFGYPEDLGMQVGPMLSPAHFRKYIKPVYLPFGLALSSSSSGGGSSLNPCISSRPTMPTSRCCFARGS